MPSDYNLIFNVNDILSEIIYFFKKVVNNWAFFYHNSDGEAFIVPFVSLFIGAVLLDKILSLFFHHYYVDNFDTMSDDDF